MAFFCDSCQLRILKIGFNWDEISLKRFWMFWGALLFICMVEHPPTHVGQAVYLDLETEKGILDLADISFYLGQHLRQRSLPHWVTRSWLALSSRTRVLQAKQCAQISTEFDIWKGILAVHIRNIISRPYSWLRSWREHWFQSAHWLVCCLCSFHTSNYYKCTRCPKVK